MQIALQHNDQKERAQNLGVWIFLATVIMIFAGFTSALIVRAGQGDWALIDFPSAFYYNTVILVLSSLSMQSAWNSIRKGNTKGLQYGLGITFALGILFLIGQYNAWQELLTNGVGLTKNVSYSFMYIITGAHAVHIAGAVFFLLYVSVKSFSNIYTDQKHFAIKACAIFWHFLGVLWIYLFVFLYMYQQQ